MTGGFGSFNPWQNPGGGGFNWNMLTNVGAGMLANSQYAPGQAFGKGYQQAMGDSLEQAKAGAIFQEMERKKKADEQAAKFREQFAPLLGGQQAPPQAGAAISGGAGLPMAGGGAEAPMGPAASGAPPQMSTPPMPQFDQGTYQQLIQAAAIAEANGQQDIADGLKLKAQAMATQYQQQMGAGQFALDANKAQFDRYDRNRAADLNERKFFEETQGKPARERVEKLTAEEYNARSAKSKLGLMRKYVEDKNFYSGPFAESVALPFKQAMAAAGIGGADQASSMEAFNSLSKQGIIDKAGGSLGNQISKSDTDIIGKTVPNLQNSVEGNKQVIDILERIHDRNIEYAKQARAYLSKHKSLQGFDDEFAAWADKHSLFEGMNLNTTPTSGIPTYTPGQRIQWGQ